MKNLLFIFVFLFTFFNISFSQDKVKEAEDLIKKKDYAKAFVIAEELFKANDYNNTIKVLMILNEKDKNNKKVIELMGDSYNKTKVYELALSLFYDAEKLDSTNIDLKFKIAKIHFRNKDYTEAANKYLNILSIDTANVKALEEVGLLLYAAKEYSSSLIYLTKLLNYEKKLEIFQYTVKAYLKLKNYPKAFEYAKEALSKYPGDQDLTRDMVTASVETRNLDEAVKFIENLPDSLTFANDFYKIAVAYHFVQKNDSLAIQYYLRTLQEDSTVVEAINYAARLAFKNKRYELAAELFMKKLSINAKDYEAAKYLGFVYLQDKKFDLAAIALKNAIAIIDTEATLTYWLAVSLNASKQDVEAIDAYKDFLSKIQGKEENFKEQSAEANGNIGLRLFANKRHNEAIPYLRKAVQLDPKNVDFNLWLASCFHQTEKIADAVDYYKRVVKLDPKNQAAHKALKSLGEE